MSLLKTFSIIINNGLLHISILSVIHIEKFCVTSEQSLSGATVINGDSFIDWSHFNKALQDNGFESVMPPRTDIRGNIVTTTPTPQATSRWGAL